MTNPSHLTEYANTLKGAALYALDMWRWTHEQVDQTPGGEERAFLFGRRQAYAAVVKQITGRQPENPEALDIIADIKS